MNIALISWIKDKAGMNIKEHLINNHNFSRLEEQFDGNDIFQCVINDKEVKLYTIDSKHIFTEDLDKRIDADVFIFTTTHSAAEGIPSLTCHPIGNFGKAEKGGKEKTLCVSHSILLKNIFIELDKNVIEPFKATMEATHHGPFMEKPVLFVEIGSTEKEWGDKNAGNIIAKSVVNALKKNKNYESVFVIGGGHYNHVATKAMLKSNLAVGHICAKYNLENLDYELVKQAMEKTVPKAEFVLLDWKGLSKEKQRIAEILEKNNIEYKRSDNFFEKNG